MSSQLRPYEHIPWQIIKGYLDNTDSTELSLEHRQLLDRVFSLQRTLQRWPQPRTALALHRSKFPEISRQTAFNDLQYARELENTYHSFDYEFWNNWLIQDILDQIQGAKSRVDIWSRGTRKSYLVGWDIHTVNRKMPGALISVTGQTYGQLLTRTLPSTFKFLESLGYQKDKNYVVGRRPPQNFYRPLEKVMKFDNLISFSNGNAILMLSQDRIGSARGANVDYEILDEALTIDKERYDQETSPTNRGNETLWGSQSPSPNPFHHGYHYVSSMPYTQTQKWLLSFANYYHDEAGIQLLPLWNRIVKLQMELIPAYYDQNFILFKEIWNESIRLRRAILPFVSRTGLLFTLANAFDNVDNVGMSYIARECEKQNLLTFMVEIMNRYWIASRIAITT